jgi:hypothetical protein
MSLERKSQDVHNAGFSEQGLVMGMRMVWWHFTILSCYFTTSYDLFRMVRQGIDVVHACRSIREESDTLVFATHGFALPLRVRGVVHQHDG